MKILPTFSDSNSIQKENLLNELKGILFEYLVAQQLARIHKIESHFINALSAHYLQQLQNYEGYLRAHDRTLLLALPPLAQQVAKEIADTVPVQEPWQKIFLLGKYASLSDLPHREQYAEADIVLWGPSQQLPISLKLCKSNSFVHTKNAGAQSFIEKYFQDFREASFWQSEFNHALNEQYLTMIQELYEEQGLVFTGTLDEQWREQNLSELPGELPPPLRQITHRYPNTLIQKIHHYLSLFYQEDKDLFLACLYPLLGFGAPEILQVCCFHEMHKGEKEHLKDIHILSFANLKKENMRLSLNIHNQKEGTASFIVELPKCLLQIRLKPMNKFTVPGLKVNCAVKFR